MTTPTIQDIFQKMSSDGRIDFTKLNTKQQKVLNHITMCKTPEMGFNKDVCESCGDIEIHYNSCKDPNCPQCQAFDREVWIHKQNRFTLRVNYFHVVFTIPNELNTLALLDPRCIYSILFSATSETLKELARDEKYLGADIGFTAVLHTWGQNLSLHPHIHCIVPGGGLDKNGKWKDSRKKFFLPVKALSKLFRGKFLSRLKTSFNIDLLEDKAQFKEIIDKCYEKDWVVYTKKPMKSAKAVIEYLGRYTHRIAISNARIIKYENNKVTFRYKDYRDGNAIKEMTLDDTEFFRRYMMHVLPKSFMKIRHFGFLGNRNKEDRMKVLRQATETPDPIFVEIDKVMIISKLIKRDVTICLSCGNKRHHHRLE